MIAFPDINPVAFSIGNFDIYWYSFAYIIGILIGWFYARQLAKEFALPISEQQIEKFVTWAIIGIIAGGRLGYVFFYDPVRYLLHPVDILKTYQGGMAFHGAGIGLILASYFFSKVHKVKALLLLDLIVLVCPIGLFLGRCANFINAELYGRITDVPWAIIFPGSDMMPRHPSQLYEAFFEGIVLFCLLFYLTFRKRILQKPGLAFGIFLVVYAIFRIIIENFREPDFYLSPYFTMGQLLSIIMFFPGCYLIFKTQCQLTPK